MAIAEKNRKKKEFINDAVFLLLLSVIFLGSSAIFLNLPGLGDEETFLIYPAVSILKGMPSEYLVVELFRHRVFTMICAWVGPVSALLYFPSLSLFGCNMYVMRLTRIFYGFIIITLLYYCVKRIFGRGPARISAFLMASLPYYIFMYRHGYLDDGILPLFLLASLLCFYYFYKKEKAKYLYLGALFCGLGVISKLNFIWYLMALGVCALALRIKINVKKRHILIALIIFIALCSPLAVSSIAYSKNPKANLISVIKNNFSVSTYGQDNSLFLENVKANSRSFNMVLSNDAYAYAVQVPMVRERRFLNFLYLPLFLISVIFYLARLIFAKKDKSKKVNLLILMIITVFLFKNFTISIFRLEHFTIIIPLVIIVVASFINEFNGKKYLWAGYSIIAIITLLNIASAYRTYEILYRSDECRMFNWSHPSSSIYKLSDYLTDNGIYRPVSIVPELYCNIKILTQGRVSPVRDYANADWKSYIREDGGYYITRLDHKYIEWFNDFSELAQRCGKSVVVDKVFFRKDGTMDMMVFRLKKYR